MSYDVEKEAAIAEEVKKRRSALREIINVQRLRDELLTEMLKAGAMVGGGSFLFGLLFMYDGRVSFAGLVALSLVVFIAVAFVYATEATTAFESAVGREIRRRMRERA